MLSSSLFSSKARPPPGGGAQPLGSGLEGRYRECADREKSLAAPCMHAAVCTLALNPQIPQVTLFTVCSNRDKACDGRKM